MSAMYECIVEAPVSTVIALFAETDLFTKWMPNITEMTFLKEISNYRKLCSFKQHMPWPIAQRDLMVRFSGQYDQKNRAVLSVVKSIST
jgi:hypothetical protein